MKKIFLMLMCAITMVGFSSCEKDDKVKDSKIIGIWDLVYEEDIKDGEIVDRYEYEEGEYYYEFKKDGTGSWVENDVNDVDDMERWSLDSEILTVVFGEEDVEIYTIIELTKDEMILEEEDGDYTYREHYKKR